MNIIKADDTEKREFTATVYSADSKPDLQNDTMSYKEVYLAMLRFSADPEIRIMHSEESLPHGLITVLSNFMTGKASGGLPANSWLLTGKISKTPEGDILWERIKSGARGEKYITIDGEQLPSLTGFSMGGVGDRVEETN